MQSMETSCFCVCVCMCVRVCACVCMCGGVISFILSAPLSPPSPFLSTSLTIPSPNPFPPFPLFHAFQVHFTDGSARDFDHILLATGFNYAGSPYTAFLPRAITDALPDENGVVHSGKVSPGGWGGGREDGGEDGGEVESG